MNIFECDYNAWHASHGRSNYSAGIIVKDFISLYNIYNNIWVAQPLLTGMSILVGLHNHYHILCRIVNFFKTVSAL